uniref:Large envelope protein n=1 Tax=Bat Hepatitis B virus TaxID=1401315 RepID=A0A2H5BVJ4_HBV|nr:surface protein [Bat Hepatitis B virus]
MGQNGSIPNPLGFFPGHEMTPEAAPDPMFGPGPYTLWDSVPATDPRRKWPQAWQQATGAWGPSLVPPHGGLLGTAENAKGTLVTFHPDGSITKKVTGQGPIVIKPAPPPQVTNPKPIPVPPTPATNRNKGRAPTPVTPPTRVTHPHLNMTNTTWRQRYASLLTTASGSTSETILPADPTASSSVPFFWTTGDPVSNMGNISSELLGPLVGFQVVFFLWTKILTIAQSLDSWWTSLSFPGGIPECFGLNLQSPTCKHSPTSCPPTCAGFRWMCLRRFIIYLLVLLLCLIFLLVLLDWRGLLPVCPLNPTSQTTMRCSACTISAADTISFPYCCCSKPSGGNCTCWPIPSSWAFGKFLWELASLRFSWLNSLVPLLQWFAELSPTAWLLVIWMTWYWGPGLLSTLSPFIPLFVLFSLIWGYV